MTDWFLSKCNPDPPNQNVWIKPSVLQYEDIDCILNDNNYVDSLNSVQRHTHCSTSYCLKNSVNKTELECRFNFPLQKWEKTTLFFEAIHTKDNRKKYKLTVATKINDPRHILDCIASSNCLGINHG